MMTEKRGLRSEVQRTRILAATTFIVSLAFLLSPNALAVDQSVADPEMRELLSDLRSGSLTDAQMRRLAEKRELALPELKAGMEVKEIRATCAEIVSWMPPNISAPVLIDAIERVVVETRADLAYKTRLFATLGDTKWGPAVAFLEAQYLSSANQEEILRKNIAWALKNITGKDYGPAEDIRYRW